MTIQNKIYIFTDGASSGNPGSGGWASIVINGDEIKEYGGAENLTTNNRMEITAAVEGLRNTPQNSDIVLYTDSSYLINGITKWVHGWIRNGWITRAKDDVLNRDLWEKLNELAKERNVSWNYVGGHSGIAGNERCDVIATTYSMAKEPELFSGNISDYPVKNILDLTPVNEKVEMKKSSSSRSRAKAFSYISKVAGKIQKHSTWEECEKRVKGVKGARFKKSLSHEDEENIIDEFSK